MRKIITATLIFACLGAAAAPALASTQVTMSGHFGSQSASFGDASGPDAGNTH